MKIQPIQLYNIYQQKQKLDTPNVNYNNLLNYSNEKQNDFIPTTIISSIKFCGVIHPQSEKLKKLLKYKIPDIYSEITLIDPSVYEKLMKTKVYEKPIGSLIKTILQYEKSFVPSEKVFIEIIRSVALRNPKKTLEQVVHDLFPEHNKILMKEQQTILDKIKLLSEQIPEPQQELLNNLMHFTNEKMERRPIFKNFNVKEFKYKLNKIVECIRNKNDLEERYAIREIEKIGNKLPQIIPETEKISRNDKAQHRKFLRQNRKNVEQTQLNLLAKMDYVMDNSVLRNNRELRILLTNSRSMIYKLPIIYPFNRKTFIYDLRKIVSTLEDKKLAKEIMEEAKNLPTSKDSASAFIVKSALSSSEKIFQDLFSGARGTVEHIIPTQKKGQDCLMNYVLASAWRNNERGHRSFADQLRKYPYIYQTAQNHVNKLIELYNNGFFNEVGMRRGYIINLVALLRRLSPPEKPLIINISTLQP